MPFTFQGVGTKYYGKRDFRADGTYITTEWSVLASIPVLPIRSLGVRYLGRGRNPSEPGLRPGPLYQIYEETNPNWLQIVCVYGYLAFLAWWLFLFGRHFDDYTKGLGEIPGAMAIVFGFVWPVFIPATLRFFGKRRKGFTTDAPPAQNARTRESATPINQSPPKRRPICGCASILLPGLAAVPYYWHPPLSGDSGLGYIFFFGLLFFTSTILGGLLALIAFARREPYLLFPCLGFLISAVLLLGLLRPNIYDY